MCLHTSPDRCVNCLKAEKWMKRDDTQPKCGDEKKGRFSDTEEHPSAHVKAFVGVCHVGCHDQEQDFVDWFQRR